MMMRQSSPPTITNIYNNYCSLRPMVPLSTDWNMLRNEIDEMVAGGAGIRRSVCLGPAVLTNGALLSNDAPPSAA